MKSLIFFAVAGLTVAVVNAQFMPQREVPANSALGKLRAKDKEHAGGYVVKPGTMKGRFLIADAQGTLAATNFTAMAANMTEQSGFDFHYARVDAPKDMAWGALAQKEGSSYVIGLIADANFPPLLVAPESKWALVNVTGVEAGMAPKAKARFLASRVRKEVIRAFAMLCAGCRTQFGSSVLSAECPSDLDKYPEMLPMDVLQAAFKKLAEAGMQPRKRVAYRQACIEGWAHQPTNDLEKAVWKDVHALPTKPITIEPEK